MRIAAPDSGRFATLKNKTGIIISRSQHLRRLVDEMLVGAGYTSNTFTTDHEGAILNLRYGATVSFVLCEATDKYKDHLHMAKFIRWNHLCTTPQMPFIIYGETWTSQSLTVARNCGATGIIAFPCTIHGFMRRFVNAVCNPPPFITCETYRGPDRRTANSSTYNGPKRRRQDLAATSAPQTQTQAKAPPPPPPKPPAQAGAIAQSALYSKLQNRKQE